MAYYHCIYGGGSSGGITPVKLIDYELYSHPSAFDSISLPQNYTDYDVLYMAIIQEGVDQNAFDENMPLIRGCGIVSTSSISATDIVVYVPIYDNNFNNFSTGTTYINSSRILGNNYPLSWQNLYLVCYGIKL